PAGILIAVLAWRRRVAGAHADLARIVFAASVAAIISVWTISNAVSLEARHLASAGMCMLPLALAEGAILWRESGSSIRAMLASAAVCFVVVPFAYGIVSVAAKVRRFPADYRPAPTSLYAPLLAAQDGAGVIAYLKRDFDPARDVWYLTEPITALSL